LERIYEGMFLIDNALVREDWNKAKSVVTEILGKHGGTVLSARRWDERRLCYPIKGKNRATFLLTYYNIPAENIPSMRRDFELNEGVLRSLELVVDEIPTEESELVEKEGAADFKVPTPPDDDHVDFVEEPDDFGRDRRDDRDDRGGSRRRDGAESPEAGGEELVTEETVSATEEN
jgi:small subunit ribosomal protein S6